ncbi:hypothetical protein [Pseudomonas japonica]|uniref:hypothetical protein n=1 Tax=Pseudomonas japonica TaxID=256466 RepID=UPI0015E27027|nr:hypothetical protein [Pseudomonas japonica]MBA1245907.1 hypothetical protein [Pseudomonas japonica]
MESNKESSGGLSFWLPGGAVLVSLAISTFVLQRQPFVDARPASPPVVTQPPIDARLWQDPFDALARYRASVKDTKEKSGGKIGDACTYMATAISDPEELKSGGESLVNPQPPKVMVALVRGAAYADEIELRRRIRYAILAGFKTSRRVPLDESHIRCLRHDVAGTSTEIPYEAFGPDPFDPPLNIDEVRETTDRTVLFWVNEEALGDKPLDALETLREPLHYQARIVTGPALSCPANWPGEEAPLKVIGPSSSAVLRKMYQEEAALRSKGKPVPQLVEIYSPLATAERTRLMEGMQEPSDDAKRSHPDAMKLLRTVSDDGTLSSLLLEELKLRHVDPALAMQCARSPEGTPGLKCPASRWEKSNRVAIIAEWDSFYSRALIESFKAQVAKRAGLMPEDDPSPNPVPVLSTVARLELDQWVMRFGYLRGLDGRLPEKPSTSAKPASEDKASPENAPRETADGDGQLDYLRRLADHIARADKKMRDEGGEGIGAIGIFGQDTYDKLLALQALKSRMPTKVYFSTDLDARMLQQGQAKTTRNLVLAAPYGLTLTRALQQDVPPFRESLQSAVYIAVLAALAPQGFEAKRGKFDYSKSSLLSPSIYEIGASGFIPLASTLDRQRPPSCSVGSLADKGGRVRAQDIMALQCLQDPPPPAYLDVSPRIQEWLGQTQSFFLAGPLALLLLVIGVALAWWHTERNGQYAHEQRAGWAQRAPMAMYATAAFFAWLATRWWSVEFLWLAGVIAVLGGWCQGRNRQQVKARLSGDDNGTTHLSDGGAGWYVVIPALIFTLVLLWGYQHRAELTGQGLGEPMFLWEGISAWPTVILRVLAAAISLVSIAWAWRKLSVNRRVIEREYCLDVGLRGLPVTLFQQWQSYRAVRGTGGMSIQTTLGRLLHRILLPLPGTKPLLLPPGKEGSIRHKLSSRDGRLPRSLVIFWAEHRAAGSMPARMARVVLFTWLFLVVTSAVYVLLPVEDVPIRGDYAGVWLWTWVVHAVAFQMLVFWVMDANLLLSRFIRQLSQGHFVWPKALRAQWATLPSGVMDAYVDDYLTVTLIAKRTSAVNRLIYAPTLVMLVLMASRSTVFDNWPAPLSSSLILALNAAILLGSALTLRRAAERAREVALARLDHYLLQGTHPENIGLPSDRSAAEEPGPEAICKQLNLLRQRIKDLRTGAFAPYSEEPFLRAVMVSLTGLGGTAILEAMNLMQF